MDSGLLERLRRASLEKGFEPDRDVDWSNPFQEGDPSPFPESLLSLSGLPCFETLTPSERARLARHEAASVFSISIRFEDLLMRGLSRRVQRGDPLDPKTPYYLHEIEEEARHNRMFVRTIQALGTGSYPLAGVLGRLECTLASLVMRAPCLFTLATLAVEEITDGLFKRWMEPPGCHPVLHQVCRIHRVEEARHILFARADLRERYSEAGRLERRLVRIGAPLVLHLIFDLLVPPAVYRRAGLVGTTREAYALWWSALRSPQRRALRAQLVASLERLLEELGVRRATRAPVHLGWSGS